MDELGYYSDLGRYDGSIPWKINQLLSMGYTPATDPRRKMAAELYSVFPSASSVNPIMVVTVSLARGARTASRRPSAVKSKRA